MSSPRRRNSRRAPHSKRESCSPWRHVYDDTLDHCAEVRTRHLREVLGEGDGFEELISALPESHSALEAALVEARRTPEGRCGCRVRDQWSCPHLSGRLQRAQQLLAAHEQCVCEEEARHEAHRSLDAQLRELRFPGWIVTSSEQWGEAEHAFPYPRLNSYELGRFAELWEGGFEVSWDGALLVLRARGEEVMFHPVSAARAALWQLLAEAGEANAAAIVLEIEDRLVEVVSSYLTAREEIELPLALDPAAALSDRELEVARGLAPGWSGALAELWEASRACVAP